MEKKLEIYAKCSFSACNNEAEWNMGTWQCCDKCAETWITETQDGWGYSLLGTSSRSGQKSILEHNLRYNLKHNIVAK